MFPFRMSHLARIPSNVCQHVGDPPEPFLGKYQVAIVFPRNELGGAGPLPVLVFRGRVC